MKKLFIALVCLSCYGAAQAQDQKANATDVQQNTNVGKFKFKSETHDFGEVAEGPNAECDFEFKNVGKEPIIITEAHGSCGCTVPQWPKEPIMPGKKAKIHVSYSTAGRPGPITKDVYITSNGQPSPMVLHIRGTVKAKSAEVAPEKK
ncbi:MAG: DUF1573 domain-containing protein [Bacteroidetes bacterium]|nr:DUF1573 domain-containing protein [Bacteroidota bacterium]MBS1740966.1 DUF1573 domain-containing protein [Bacteroidota bacterium]MBS1777244.1 DUF1573 domain-containing protein [Bacteroidota bacterium]